MSAVPRQAAAAGPLLEGAGPSPTPRVSATISSPGSRSGPSAADGSTPMPPSTASAVTDVDVAATAILP